MQFNAIFNRLTASERDFITSNSVGIQKATFTFDSTWNKFISRTAVFECGEKRMAILLDSNNSCIVPWEIYEKGLEGNLLYVAVYGVSPTNEVLPTNYVNNNQLKRGADLSMVSPQPTPSLLDQILADNAYTRIYTEEKANIATQGATTATEQAVISTTQAGVSTDASLVSTENSYKTSQDAQETENDKQATLQAKNEALQAVEDAQISIDNFNQQLGKANGIATLDENTRVVQDANNAMKLNGQLPTYYASVGYVDNQDRITETNANQFTDNAIETHNTSNVAHQDIRNEIELKANSNDVYTKNQSDDLYARKLVYQRLYISNQGILSTAPTAPLDGVQFTLSSNTTNYQTLFDIQRVTTTDIVLSNENAFVQDYSMGFSRSGSMIMKFTIYTPTEILGTLTTGEVLFNGNSTYPVINLPPISVILNNIADGGLVTIAGGEAYNIKCEIAFNTTDEVTAKLFCLKDSYVSTTQNAQQAVSINTDNINDDAITTSKIANNAVTDIKIDSVSGSKVNGAVANATDAVNATNVTTKINNKLISDIFETNGTTVKNATDAVNSTNAVNANNADTLDNKGEASLNVLTSTKLATPRVISISGVAQGSNTFDGSQNIDIPLKHVYIAPTILIDSATVVWDARQTNYVVVTLTAERNLNITNIVAGFYGVCHSYGNGFNLTQLATDGWIIDPTAQFITLPSADSMYVHTFSYDGIKKVYRRTVVG